MAWLKLTAASGRHPVFGDPGPLARASLAHPDVALLADLLPLNGNTYTPDLLTPQPGTDAQRRDLLDEQIAQIEAAAQNDLETQVFTYTRALRVVPAHRTCGRPAGRSPRLTWWSPAECNAVTLVAILPGPVGGGAEGAEVAGRPAWAGRFNDVTRLIPLIQAVPPVRGRRGRLLERPRYLYADRGCDREVYRDEVRRFQVTPYFGRRGTGHGSGLGV
ncbi:hypothetical protein [Streptomyces sp. WM6386]|uniref:hypothetical protein n=1 Tax=Streptomyces sp. WM6386 TaxID=1415558 RepID=UPI0007C66BD5|nr:hypothetical protein [Streptomyces sp. WM6386]